MLSLLPLCYMAFCKNASAHFFWNPITYTSLEACVWEKCAQLSRAKINYNRIKGRQILNAALLEECVEFTNIKA